MSEYIKKEDILACQTTFTDEAGYEYKVIEVEEIDELPTYSFPDREKGEWIYDKGIENWRCSKCGQTPPPTGYVGKADFMATHFKFCNHCGTDMRGNANE